MEIFYDASFSRGGELRRVRDAITVLIFGQKEGEKGPGAPKKVLEHGNTDIRLLHRLKYKYKFLDAEILCVIFLFICSLCSLKRIRKGFDKEIINQNLLPLFFLFFLSVFFFLFFLFVPSL